VKNIRVGVVMGGVSSEREVSLRSGEAVGAALEGVGYDVDMIELGPGADALETLSDSAIDVAFLALHGKQGEDGCVQGVLEVLGIPYTGSGVLASALCMDKLKSKELFRLHNIPTAPYYSLNRSELNSIRDAHGSFGFPVVVKPRREGSSVGVCKVNNWDELSAAVESAFIYDEAVLVERFVAGQEIAVAVLDGEVLGAIEIEVSGELYDYEAKYQSSETRYHQPARLPEARVQGLLNIAERSIQALDIRGAARVDMIVTEGMNEYVLEVNTLPGLTETSLLPKIAKKAGYSFSALCDSILEIARLDSGLSLSNVRESVSLQHDETVWEDATIDEACLAYVPAASRNSSVKKSVAS
jgi:D-alanine-D-alanine ligase